MRHRPFLPSFSTTWNWTGFLGSTSAVSLHSYRHVNPSASVPRSPVFKREGNRDRDREHRVLYFPFQSKTTDDPRSDGGATRTPKVFRRSRTPLALSLLSPVRPFSFDRQDVFRSGRGGRRVRFSAFFIRPVSASYHFLEIYYLNVFPPPLL